MSRHTLLRGALPLRGCRGGAWGQQSLAQTFPQRVLLTGHSGVVSDGGQSVRSPAASPLQPSGPPSSCSTALQKQAMKPAKGYKMRDGINKNMQQLYVID